MIDLVTGACLFGGGVVVGALWQKSQKVQDSQTAWRPPPPAGQTPFGGGALSPEVRELALQGRKIEAIKLHREQTGLGLKESKDAVERITG